MNKLQRIEEMERQLAALKAEVSVESKQDEKWEPQGGAYFIDIAGEVGEGRSDDVCRLFGVERKTLELAQKASKQMRLHNRILAYVHQYAPDWDGRYPYYVFVRYGSARACGLTEGDLYPSLVAMPQHVAEQLANDINSGRFDLEG